MLTFFLVWLMIFNLESLTMLNYTKMILACDQIHICIGLTALINAIIAEPMKTMIMQAGFFTFMIGQNFYLTWNSQVAFAVEHLQQSSPSTYTVFTMFQYWAAIIFCLQLLCYYWQIYIWLNESPKASVTAIEEPRQAEPKPTKPKQAEKKKNK